VPACLKKTRHATCSKKNETGEKKDRFLQKEKKSSAGRNPPKGHGPRVPLVKKGNKTAPFSGEGRITTGKRLRGRECTDDDSIKMEPYRLGGGGKKSCISKGKPQDAGGIRVSKS